MKFGFIASYGTIHDYVQMAREAESHGWDGIFAWDDISVERGDIFDPWVALGAMAAVTEHITLGAMIFSLARRRPWKVAHETITLDNLSNGRLVLPVGLGGTWDGGYARVNTDDPAIRVRAEKLDECLDILELAWTGETVSYEGKHYQMRDLQFDQPVQRPRIPIWPVGAWPHPRSLRRAARWDGVIASDTSSETAGEEEISPAVVAAIGAWMGDHRDRPDPFDIVVEGVTSGNDPVADRTRLEPLAAAGTTWWIESRWESDQTPTTLFERIRQGPPQL